MLPKPIPPVANIEEDMTEWRLTDRIEKYEQIAKDLQMLLDPTPEDIEVFSERHGQTILEDAAFFARSMPCNKLGLDALTQIADLKPLLIRGDEAPAPPIRREDVETAIAAVHHILAISPPHKKPPKALAS